jgi:tRNA G18 (ribose-2'-O)-methylase SpoU
VSLGDRGALLPLPERVAIVMGRESDGVTPEMLAASDRWGP